MTASDTERERVTTGDSEWDIEWQRVTTNDPRGVKSWSTMCFSKLEMLYPKFTV